MDPQQQLHDVLQQARGLKLMVGKEALIAALEKNLGLVLNAELITTSAQDTAPATDEATTHSEENAVIQGDLIRIDGRNIFIQQSAKEEAEQIFSSIKLKSLRDELIKDYYFMHLHQQLGNVYEGARLAYLQMENIVNCGLETKDVINKIKNNPPLQQIWVYDYDQKKPTKKHPAEFAYGQDREKWPKESIKPSSTRVSFFNKLTLYFAYCANENLRDGFKDGLIDNRLFKEIVLIKSLRDSTSHRFAMSDSVQVNLLLQCSIGEAFSKMRSTLQIFRNNMPSWL